MTLKKILEKKGKGFWPVVISLAVLLIILIISASKPKQKEYKFISVERSDLKQIVSVTGKVAPNKNLDLAFSRSGKVQRIFLEVGEVARQGQLLVELENSSLIAQKKQAQANLNGQMAKMRELEIGSRPEQIDVYRSNLQKAEGELFDLYKKALVTLKESYNSSANTFRESLKSMYDYYPYNDPPLYQLNYYACNALAYNKANADRLEVEKKLNQWELSISQLSSAPTDSVIDQQIDNANSYLQFFQDYLATLNNTLVISCNMDAVYQARINSYRPVVSAAITALNTTFTNIKDVRKNINSQKLSVQNYKDQLTLTSAKPTQEQIDFQQAQVDSAQASLDMIESQILETRIFAPIAGMVRAVNIDVGENVNANQTAISLISQDLYKIEAYINETDVAKLNVGNSADLSFDALPQQKYKGEIIMIDPAQTIIDGVVTYKITLKIIDYNQSIKSGMTADIDILTAQKDNVLSLPQRAIFKKEGKVFVRILENGNEKEKEISIGIKGDNGNVEITGGLAEGEKAIE